LTAERVDRRLAAVLAADVAGYSRLMAADEEGTLARLKAVRKSLVDPTIAKHRGRIVKTTGDGMLVEFASAVDAVRGAVEIQRGVAEQNASIPQDQRIEFRVGIHVGDIIVDDNDIFGEGVNVAARLESIADAGGVCISNDAYRQVRGKVEIVCDDMGPQPLKNIAEPMKAWRVRLTVQSSSVVRSTGNNPQALPLPDKPSIAVLPFQNMSGDPEQEYFVDGMVEDIITALSRFKSLFVIARNSSFTYKGNPVDIKQVGRELGVRYVLEGSVRKAAGRVRITGQLIEASTGTHLWADKIDGSLEDIFELQDRVTSSVVAAIAPKLDQAEIERANRKPLLNLDAYDCILKGMDCANFVGDREKNEEALRFFCRAIELDPQSASAYGWAANRYFIRKMNGWIVDNERDFVEARRLAECAIRFGQDDARALSQAGWVLSFLFSEHENASTLIDSAIAINPNLAYAWRARAFISMYLGEHERALDEVDRTIRLNPVDPQTYNTEAARAFALLFLGKYDEACYWAARVLTRQPKQAAALRAACVGHALSGRLAKAQEAMRRLREIDSVARLSNVNKFFPFRRQEDIARMIEGYRLAGMPE
jgi:TolB-like protein/class 3 adenylate cyclase